MNQNDPIYNLRFNINHYGADYTIDGLVDRMRREEFVFPDFQRDYVWKADEASKFIESLLLGLPVPSLFFARDKYSHNLIVIDGQQRLRTLHYFYDGEFPNGKPFKLTKVSPHFAGQTFQDLLEEDKRNLSNTVIHCVIIAENEESNRMFYLFERLNTTGNALTNQEIRNAIYRGRFNDLLKELSNSELWLRTYTGKNKRLEGQELILRFLAFTFGIEQYSGSLTDFLNEFMLHNRSLELFDDIQITRTFNETFRRIGEATQYTGFNKNGKFNRVLFDTLSVYVSQNLERVQTLDSITRLQNEILNSEEFWDLSKGATTSKRSLFERIQFVDELYSRL